VLDRLLSKMSGSTRVLLAALIAVLLAVALLGYYEVTSGTHSSNSATGAFVTGTSDDTVSDTLFTSTCVFSGGGAFGLLIVSDSDGTPVHGETVNAVDRLGCGSEQQVVYLDDFTIGQGGWLTPVFPSQTTVLGQLNFTVTYQGATYHFSTSYPDLGASCVTLHVPSGNVTTSLVMRYPCQ
jgi:hypothetical protein